MMVVSDTPKIIVNDINIIYKPKPKKVYKSNLKLSPLSNIPERFHGKRRHHHKNKKTDEYWDLNLNKNRITKSQNFESISFEEIENDFKNLKARTERIQFENELLKILENSTKDTSFEEEEKKNKKIERPKNILYKNMSEYM